MYSYAFCAQQKLQSRPELYRQAALLRVSYIRKVVMAAVMKKKICRLSVIVSQGTHACYFLGSQK